MPKAQSLWDRGDDGAGWEVQGFLVQGSHTAALLEPLKARESLSKTSTKPSSTLQRVGKPLLPSEFSHLLFLLHPDHNSSDHWLVYRSTIPNSKLLESRSLFVFFFPVLPAKCLTCIANDVIAFDKGTKQLMVLFFLIIMLCVDLGYSYI